MTNSKTRVWMIAPTPFFSDRGCHVRILEEIYALKEQGVEVGLFTYHLGRDIEGVQATRTINVPWYKKQSPGPSYHKLYLDIFLFITSFVKLLKFNDRPNILHGHLHEGAFIAIFLKIFFRVPVIFDVQGSLVDELQSHKFIKKGRFLYKLFYCLESFIYNKSDHLIVSSKNTAELIKKQFSIPDYKVTVVMDGVRTTSPPFHQGSDIDSGQMSELKLPSHKVVIGYLGALNNYQGIDILLKVIKEISLLPDISRLHFLIMGYPNVEKYLTIAEELEIERYVTFTGRVPYEKINNLLSQVNIAVSPKISLTEANGKIINYMAMGLPVVAYNTPVNRQYLGGDYEYYANLDVEGSFRDCLLKLLRQGPEAWQKVGQNLKNRVTSEFEMGRIANQILKVYNHEQNVNRDKK